MIKRWCLGIGLGLVMLPWVYAGNQKEEALSSSVQSVMRRSIASHRAYLPQTLDHEAWFNRVSPLLLTRIPDEFTRKRVLAAIYYEATRAGLDPLLVLALVQIESGFRPYAISSVGARGLMQVMPFWQRVIGVTEHSLFDLNTNLRYGCTILRHYIDIEQGDLFHALGRYNGSRGKPQYPNMVLSAVKKYTH